MRCNRPTFLQRTLLCAVLLVTPACGSKETVSIKSEYGTHYKVDKATTSITPYAIETLRAFTDRREKELCLKHFDSNFCSYRYSRMLGLAEEQALKESMAFAERIEAEKNIITITYQVDPDPQDPKSGKSAKQSFNCINPKFKVRTIAEIKEYLGLKPPGVKLPRNDQSIHGKLEFEMCKHWAKFSWL